MGIFFGGFIVMKELILSFCLFFFDFVLWSVVDIKDAVFGELIFLVDFTLVRFFCIG